MNLPTSALVLRRTHACSKIEITSAPTIHGDVLTQHCILHHCKARVMQTSPPRKGKGGGGGGGGGGEGFSVSIR